MASTGNLLRRNWPVSRSVGFNNGRILRLPDSLREAIVCLKRALVAADPHEITIRLKLAKLHRALDEVADAVSYHRKIVDICQADR